MKFFDQVGRVVVIGCGGTGSILIPQLTRYLYSIRYKGKIIFADGDAYEDKNKDRQTFSPKFIGTNKAEYQAKATLASLESLGDQIEFIPEYLNEEKINEIISEGTIVINCVDNKAARKYVEDRCLQLKDVAHICCGNELTNGQVQISYRRAGAQVAPSIYVRNPKSNDINDDRSKLNCQQMAQLESGGQIICANMTAASIALNYVVQILSKDTIFDNNHWMPVGTVWFDCRQNLFDREDVAEFKFQDTGKRPPMARLNLRETPPITRNIEEVTAQLTALSNSIYANPLAAANAPAVPDVDQPF